MTNKGSAPGYPIRLNRYLALCGIASRRKADELIASGRVSVDGKPETTPGRVLDAPADVRVNGEAARPVRHAYIVMNKPRGVVSAASDARERTVVDLLPERYRQLRLFPVGRLDKDSDGLIILTNDGMFAQDVIHPSKGVLRTYLVYLTRPVTENKMKEWRRGVIINERLAKPIDVTYEPGGDGRCCRVVLGEGFKREIRLMAETLGNRVTRLTRTAIGELVLEKLRQGDFVELDGEELAAMIAHGGRV